MSGCCSHTKVFSRSCSLPWGGRRELDQSGDEAQSSVRLDLHNQSSQHLEPAPGLEPAPPLLSLSQPSSTSENLGIHLPHLLKLKLCFVLLPVMAPHRDSSNNHDLLQHWCTYGISQNHHRMIWVGTDLKNITQFQTPCHGSFSGSHSAWPSTPPGC